LDCCQLGDEVRKKELKLDSPGIVSYMHFIVTAYRPGLIANFIGILCFGGGKNIYCPSNCEMQ